MAQEPDWTTRRVLIDGRGTASLNFRSPPPPNDRSAITIRRGATSPNRWYPQPNRRAGQRELIWFEAHKHELADHKRKWIAITGDQIRVAQDTFGEVRTFLDQEGIADALIVYVRENVGERELFMD